MSDNEFSRLQRIEIKIDKLADRVGHVDVTLAAQHVSLKEHIKRTNLLEQKLFPVETHVAMMSGVFKFVGIMALIATIGQGLIKLVEYLKG